MFHLTCLMVMEAGEHLFFLQVTNLYIIIRNMGPTDLNS